MLCATYYVRGAVRRMTCEVRCYVLGDVLCDVLGDVLCQVRPAAPVARSAEAGATCGPKCEVRWGGVE